MQEAVNLAAMVVATVMLVNKRVATTLFITFKMIQVIFLPYGGGVNITPPESLSTIAA